MRLSIQNSAHEEPGPPRIAVIGLGFSGAAATAALLAELRFPFSLVLIDANEAFGGGLAYDKAYAGELLNVRAHDLSLLAGERGDFAAWLQKTTLTLKSDVSTPNLGQIFAPRATFGDYVRERLFAEFRKRPDVSVQFIAEDAVGMSQLRGNKLKIRFAHGSCVECDIAIISTGYGTGKEPRRFGADPFVRTLPVAAAEAEKIVLVGSGLTMVDVLLRLRRMDCSAQITIVSRHGFLPQPQLRVSPKTEPWRALPARLASELVSDVRCACCEAVRFGDPWQGVINGLRPEAQKLWRSLSVNEQRRFLRHARVFWDVHRHRLPADVYAQLLQELSRERTVVRAGKALGLEEGRSNRLAVRWRGQQAVETLKADFIIDCSGHRPDLASPLLRGLLRNGLVRMDAHGIGLDVDEAGRVTNAEGERNETIFALGPLGAGSLFEITAAPEIAAQAQMMAGSLFSGSAPCVGVSNRLRAEAWS